MVLRKACKKSRQLSLPCKAFCSGGGGGGCLSLFYLLFPIFFVIIFATSLINPSLVNLVVNPYFHLLFHCFMLLP